MLDARGPALSFAKTPSAAKVSVHRMDQAVRGTKAPNLTRSEQSNDKSFPILDKLGFCSIMSSHSDHYFARNSHAHVFKVPVVSHDILKELVPGGTTTGAHARRSDPIRESPGRNDLDPLRVNSNFNIRTEEEIVPMAQRIHYRFSHGLSRIRRSLYSADPVPSIYSSDRVTPRAAGTRDEAHQRAGRPPPCPGSAAEQHEARVRL
jgi:hypothetical protein